MQFILEVELIGSSDEMNMVKEGRWDRKKCQTKVSGMNNWVDRKGIH